jgi:hypothetical protein
MKVLDYTVGGVGPPHVTRRDRSQYVHSFFLTDKTYLTIETAVWWIRRGEGVPLQAHRLQLCLVVAELRRLHLWCKRIARRLCAPRRHQDTYPEQELREPRKRLQDCFQHDEERGFHFVLQGTHTQAYHDWSQACLLLLACSDTYPRVWQNYVKSSYS